MNLSQRFDALDDNLKLDPTDRDRAVAEHNRLGDLLVAAGIAKRTRLQGSFARKTMLPPLHDVDKIVELTDSFRAVLDSPGGPAKAMGMIEDALRPEIPLASFELKKHALSITLPGETFDFDAVPAFNPEDGTGWIVIADTDNDAWEPSNTYVLISTIAERNQACDKKFVRQVRMVKQALKSAGLSKVLPGLHIEAFAYNAVTASVAHAEAVAAVFTTGAQMLGGAYFEPTGVDCISERLDPGDAVIAKAGLQRLADRAGEAQRAAASGDEDRAAHIWADIFGLDESGAAVFPKPIADEKGYLNSLHLGSLHVGAATAATTRSVPPTRAWRPA